MLQPPTTFPAEMHSISKYVSKTVSRVNVPCNTEQAVRLGGRHNMPPPLLYPRPRPHRGQFVVRGQELPTAYVHTKFEGRSFIRLRNIGTFRCGALIDPDLDF